MSHKKKWPQCRRCVRRAKYWSGIPVHVIRQGKLINDGLWFFCQGHVPNPDKWFVLDAGDVRNLPTVQIDTSGGC